MSNSRLEVLARLGNLGITSRLVIALICVAVLAAAANVFIDSGATLVQMVTQPEATAVAASRPTPGHRNELVDKQRAAYRASATRLALALGEFDQAVRASLEGTAPDAAVKYDRALAALAAAADAHVNEDADSASLADALLLHGRKSTALLQTTRERREATDRYSASLSSMSARLQASIDRAWKIMGRVVARQSLIKLSADLDAIQGVFSRRETSASLGSLAALLAPAEQAFAATLQGNAESFRRSQGEEWLTGMRADLQKLDASRAQFTQADQRRARLSQAFFAESDGLMRRIAEVRIAIEPAASAKRPAHTPTQSAPSVAEAAIAQSEPPGPPAAQRPAIAWLSLVVLALLTFICVLTIRSVLMQVRRLSDATRQLANGEDVQLIQPGGVRELDALGMAFTSMAKQLAAAQLTNLEAQRRLEGTVAERTRDLKNLAEKDPLTGLPNRRQLFAALDEAIACAEEQKCLMGAFYLDVDNFKTLNDSMGHAFGDRVLIEIARRLEATARKFGFASRLGGDEFMIVHEEAATSAEIVASGNAIVRAFEEPIQVEGRELIVSVSVGASIYPLHEVDAEALLRAADAALFSAKELGRSRLRLFTPELLVRASAKFAIEQRLRRAIEKQEFELFYQPEVNLRSLEVTLVEALIRWRMPDGSYQCPGEFLAVAEESGLIIEISDWVLRAAVQAAADWYHGPWPEARVAINVSPRQLLDPRFAAKLRDLLVKHRLPPHCIELELTESVLQTGPATIKALNELRSLGVAIALDDFGTGYSSIASLEQLPLTRVKLDRSLIAHMDRSARSAAIARATIGLCMELGLEVTAEGVERVEQFAALLEYGPISLQGFLLAQPMKRQDLLPAIRNLSSHCQDLVLNCRQSGGRITSAAESTAVPSAVPA